MIAILAILATTWLAIGLATACLFGACAAHARHDARGLPA